MLCNFRNKDTLLQIPHVWNHFDILSPTICLSRLEIIINIVQIQIISFCIAFNIDSINNNQIYKVKFKLFCINGNKWGQSSHGDTTVCNGYKILCKWHILWSKRAGSTHIKCWPIIYYLRTLQALMIGNKLELKRKTHSLVVPSNIPGYLTPLMPVMQMMVNIYAVGSMTIEHLGTGVLSEAFLVCDQKYER